MKKITVKGQYLGTDSRGIIIGGIPFKKGLILTTLVEETVYFMLKTGEINGWFSVKEDNYEEYCKSTGKQNRYKKATEVQEPITSKMDSNENESGCGQDESAGEDKKLEETNEEETNEEETNEEETNKEETNKEETNKEETNEEVKEEEPKAKPKAKSKAKSKAKAE